MIKKSIVKFVKEHKILYRIRLCLFFFTNKLNRHTILLLLQAFKKGCFLSNCWVINNGKNNSIIIGEGCNLNGVRFFLSGENNTIRLGNNVHVNASRHQPTFFNACSATTIFIDDDCLFSNNIEVHTTDYHTIYTVDARPSNPAKDIYIGKHCWIGLRSILLKGTKLPNNTIVGACSLVTRSYKDQNTIIAGNPAREIKANVWWDATTPQKDL